MPDLLFGTDPTPGIVSVSAGRDGPARIWRRLDGRVVEEQALFPRWFLVDDLDLLAGVPHERLDAADLREGLWQLVEGHAAVWLDGRHPYRFLILTTRLDELEATILAFQGKRRGEAPARSLRDLGAHVYWRPAVEQYLTLTGRTYYKGLTFPDLVRLQFDLETTGLDERTDRIFMINVSDSTGRRVCLDIGADGDERAVIAAFVALVRDWDPDVIENHNVFEFDISFLIRRARELGVPLALGRDGSAFQPAPDSLKVGERSESFTRYSLAGREIIDTLHAVKRYGAIDRQLRSRGLKQAAVYFGVARQGREYVNGPDIWDTFRRDPERVRRYGGDDVDEVSELSRLLMGAPFALASIVPKPYERIATSGTGQGLIEPLLVRAYLQAGHSLPRAQSSGGTFAGGRTDLFTSGVIRNVVKVDVASLYPSLMLTHGIRPASDDLDAFPRLLGALTERRLHHKAEARRLPRGTAEQLYHQALQQAMKQLINSFYGSLGTSFALFCDLEAAAEVTRLGRELLGRLLAELERRGVTLIEADTDGVFFGVPEGRSEADVAGLVAAVDAALPPGIAVELEGRYEAMYSYAEKNYVLQVDGAARMVGGAFRSVKSERYGEQFLAAAMPLLFADDAPGLHRLYLDTVARLRSRAVPTDDLCVSVILSKTPEQYRKARRKEEQYEVLLRTGQQTWKPGQRVRYYQTVNGKRLWDAERQGDYDAEHYVQKLRDVYSARLARAFRPEDFRAIFESQASLFEPDLAAIHTIQTREKTLEQATAPA